MNRKRIIDIFLGLALLGSVGLYVYSQRSPCATTITYKIGTIDAGFGVSEAAFKADIDRAGALWSNAIDKKLFVYDPKGSLTINLIYDERQAITQKEQILNSNITQATATADEVKRHYSALKAQYQTLQQAYTSAVAAFAQHQAAYNEKVAYWNNRGGAPKNEFEALEREKKVLLQEQNALEDKRVEINALGAEINAYIDKYNLLVTHINKDVNTINNDGLAGTQFEEGVYISDLQGKRINIYQFSDKTDLLRVIAHELGHSLRLDHNSNPNSIMNPVNNSDVLALSAEDLRDLKLECGIK